MVWYFFQGFLTCIWFAFIACYRKCFANSKTCRYLSSNSLIENKEYSTTILPCCFLILYIYIYIKYILYNAFEHPFVSRQLRHLQISRMFRIQILARTGNCRRQVDVKQRLRRNHWRYNKLQLFDVYCIYIYIYIYICISYNCCNC